jgi:hypothetical protein
MRQDSEETQPDISNVSNVAKPAQPALNPHGMPAGSSIREHLVRETLSDLENQLTADHHLEDDLDRKHEALPDPAVRTDSER